MVKSVLLWDGRRRDGSAGRTTSQVDFEIEAIELVGP